MRLFILSEATIDDIQNRIPILISKYFKNQSEEESLRLLHQLAEIDPTRGKYVEWLVRQFKSSMIKLPDDSEKLKDSLERFDKVKNRLEVKDIIRYTPEELTKAIEPFETSARQEKILSHSGKLVIPPGSKLVIDKPPYQVIMVTDPKAAMSLSSGTRWCTANEKWATRYVKDAPLYLVYKHGRRFALVHYGNIPHFVGQLPWDLRQFKDVHNKNIAPKDMFNIIKLIEPVTGEGISSNPTWIYLYARDIIKGRWPEGEEAIKKDPILASRYAGDVIKDRWPEIEEMIKNDSFAAYRYAKDAIKGRWPEVEEMIKNDNPIHASFYAAGVIKGRWPEAEENIKKDPEAAYHYALDVIGGRWPEGEEAIKKSPKFASMYAEEVIQGRWPEGEEVIKTSKINWDLYCKFIKALRRYKGY